MTLQIWQIFWRNDFSFAEQWFVNHYHLIINVYLTKWAASFDWWRNRKRGQRNMFINANFTSEQDESDNVSVNNRSHSWMELIFLKVASITFNSFTKMVIKVNHKWLQQMHLFFDVDSEILVMLAWRPISSSDKAYVEIILFKTA